MENYMFKAHENLKKFLDYAMIIGKLKAPTLGLLNEICDWLHGTRTLIDVVESYNERSQGHIIGGIEKLSNFLFNLTRPFIDSHYDEELRFAAQVRRIARFITGDLKLMDL